MSTATPGESERAGAVAPGGGVRLSLVVAADGHVAEVALEPAHCERLFRIAAYVALRTGRVRGGEVVAARVVPGRVRERHGGVDCLATFRVEVLDASGRVAADVEFPRRVFATFAAARGIHLLAAAADVPERPAIAYSLHAGVRGADVFPVPLPGLPRVSVAALAPGGAAPGAPDRSWIATFLTRDVVAGLDRMEAMSRARRVEVAARVSARVGVDPDDGRFVRILDRLVVVRETRATATAVVSTAASWAEYLATAPADGPRTICSVHTHLHLDVEETEPHTGISFDDVLTHYTTFPDPLAAALIVSIFPEGRVVTIYGYGPGGELREERGWSLLPV